MDAINVIKERRSIRKFKDKTLSKEVIEKILDLSIKAPSGKNRQPWRFIVLQESKKEELVGLMRKFIEINKKKGISIGSCEVSTNAIDEAPVVVLVFNAFSRFEEDYNHYRLLTDTQSIGACIQNMLLSSKNLGLGSLWICDIFYMEQEICSWLNQENELVAAVAIGYPNQSPNQRPRNSWREITEWIN